MRGRWRKARRLSEERKTCRERRAAGRADLRGRGRGRSEASNSDVAGVRRSSGNEDWLTLMPMPARMQPSENWASMPATLRSWIRTSFGQRRSQGKFETAVMASAVARPKHQCGQRNIGGGQRKAQKRGAVESRLGFGMPGPAKTPYAGGLFVGDNHRTVRRARSRQPRGLRHGGAKGGEVVQFVLRA